MRFFRVGDFVIAEKLKSGRRYSLRPWQYEVMARFDGKRSFEEAAKEIYQLRPGAFTANGLLNFYQWLYNEDLILCECESIFELVLGTSDPGEDAKEGRTESTTSLSEFAGQLLRDSRMRRILAVSAIVVLSLSVIRIVRVAAPVFEPPVNRLIAETSRFFDRTDPAVTVAVSERAASDTSVEKVSLASRVDTASPVALPSPPRFDEPAPPAHDPGEPAADPAPVGSAAPVASSLATDQQRIDMLRIQLEECRIRRDEFYLQDDEEGYRREVHRMTNLAREIGDIEKAR